jgi:hypothetical protein
MTSERIQTMEKIGKGGKIGWIALVVGVLALGFVLGGAFSRGGPGGWSERRAVWMQYQQGQQVPNVPQAPSAPQGFQRGQDMAPQAGPGFSERPNMHGGWVRGPMGDHGYCDLLADDYCS